MTRGTCLVLFAAVVLMTGASAARAADDTKKSKVESTAMKAKKDIPPQSVKSETLKKNNPASEGKLAARKGGEKPRGPICTLHVDNRTNLIVQQIFVDGELVGSVDPGGDAIGPVECGMHELYAKAYFTDGSVSWWGPDQLDCSPEDECTWTLLPAR